MDDNRLATRVSWSERMVRQLMMILWLLLLLLLMLLMMMLMLLVMMGIRRPRYL